MPELDTSIATLIFVIAAVVWVILDIQKQVELKDWRKLVKKLEVLALSCLLCHITGFSMIGAEYKYGTILTGFCVAAIANGYHKVQQTLTCINTSQGEGD